MFHQVTIIAPGLLGVSLGMACHERKLAERIVVWARRPEARAACLAQDWCAAAPDTLESAVGGADLVVFCAPVAQIVPLVRSIADRFAEGALITDVGSTKGQICREAAPLLPGGCVFVGAHPMAGSEKSGMEHASAGLFHDRPCFVTPPPNCPETAVARVEAFWAAVGMSTLRESPERHDEIVAHVSHLPHVLASVLAATLNRKAPGTQPYSGAGLRDTTRVAAGSPPMWRAICEQNRDALLGAVADFHESLDTFAQALREKDFERVEQLLAEGRQFRRSLDADSL